MINSRCGKHAKKLIIKKKIILKKYFGIWIAEESVDDCATVSLIMIVSLYELHKIMALYSCMLWTLSSWLCKSMYHVYTYI